MSKAVKRGPEGLRRRQQDVEADFDAPLDGRGGQRDPGGGRRQAVAEHSPVALDGRQRPHRNEHGGGDIDGRVLQRAVPGVVAVETTQTAGYSRIWRCLSRSFSR